MLPEEERVAARDPDAVGVLEQGKVYFGQMQCMTNIVVNYVKLPGELQIRMPGPTRRPAIEVLKDVQLELDVE